MQEAVAVIGMACRLPGEIYSPNDLWKTLIKGKNILSGIPSSRKSFKNYCDNELPDSGGFLKRIDLFDAAWFSISDRESDLMDPRQRLLLEVHAEAIADAGMRKEELQGSVTGVFVGLFTGDYDRLLKKGVRKEELNILHETGISDAAAAGRISYVFDWHGPAMSIDTACSSSLVAVHQACRSLGDGECSLAVASGVNLILTPERSLAFAKAGMLSFTGKCRAFDADADGYVRSEGVAAVVLKSLDRALKDGDRILAVINGSAVNHNGRNNGMTTPDLHGQERVIQTALKRSGILPSAVSYIEAHGTGTRLGDPVEVNALGRVYGHQRKQDNPLCIGSVKTLVGHTEAASGITGMIKTVLCLHHGYIPPHLNFNRLNPAISLKDIPAEIPVDGKVWKRNETGKPRIAGINSFGFSGTNAHVILSEGPAGQTCKRQPHPMPAFHGKSHWFCDNTDQTLSGKARNQSDLHVGLFEQVWKKKTRPGPGRISPVSSTEAVRIRLQESIRQKFTPDRLRREYELKVKMDRACVYYILSVFHENGLDLFPGRIFSTSDLYSEGGILRKYVRFAGWMLDFLSTEGILQRTGEVNEVLFMPGWQEHVSYMEMLKKGYPEAYAELTLLQKCGNSLGDILSGAVSPLEVLFPDADMDSLFHLYRDSIAFGPMNELLAQAVLKTSSGRKIRIVEIGAGTGAAADNILSHTGNHDVQYVFTDVSSLFVSRAKERYSGNSNVRFSLLDIDRPPDGQGMSLNQADVVIAANVLHATADIRQSLKHIRQLLKPGGRLILQEGITPAAWVDMIFGITEGWWKFRDTDMRKSHPLISREKWENVLSGCGFENTVSLSPPCSDEHQPLFPQAVIMAESSAGAGEQPEDTPLWLVFSDSGGTGEQFGRALRTYGEQCKLIQAGDDADVDILGAQRIIWMRGLDITEKDAALQYESQCRCLLNILKKCIEMEHRNRPAFCMVTSGAVMTQRKGGIRAAGLFQAPLKGMCEVFAREHPAFSCRLFDLDPADRKASVTLMIRELMMPGTTRKMQTAFRGNSAFIPELVPGVVADKKNTLFSPDHTYVITGGTGALGLETARRITERGGRYLALISRTGGDEAAASVIRKLKANGVHVLVIRSDVSDFRQLEHAVIQIRMSMPRIRGVIHAAGIHNDRRIADQEWKRLKAVFRAKVEGAWNLHRLTEKMKLDMFVMFSSCATLLRPEGLSGYVAANAFLDSLAYYRKGLGLPALSIDWGPWSGCGMADIEDGQPCAWWHEYGVKTMPPSEALDIFESLAGSEMIQVGAMSLNDSTESVNAVEHCPANRLSGDPEDTVRRAAAQILNLDDPDRLDPGEGFFQMGMDSLTVMAFRTLLEKTLGVRLPATLAFRYPTIEKLTAYLKETPGETCTDHEQQGGDAVEKELNALEAILGI